MTGAAVFKGIVAGAGAPVSCGRRSTSYGSGILSTDPHRSDCFPPRVWVGRSNKRWACAPRHRLSAGQSSCLRVSLLDSPPPVPLIGTVAEIGGSGVKSSQDFTVIHAAMLEGIEALGGYEVYAHRAILHLSSFRIAGSRRGRWPYAHLGRRPRLRPGGS